MTIFIITFVCTIASAIAGLIAYLFILDVKDEADDIRAFDKHKNIL